MTQRTSSTHSVTGAEGQCHHERVNTQLKDVTGRQVLVTGAAMGMGRLFADHPGLETEIEKSVATYDRLL